MNRHRSRAVLPAFCGARGAGRKEFDMHRRRGWIDREGDLVVPIQPARITGIRGNRVGTDAQGRGIDACATANGNRQYWSSN